MRCHDVITCLIGLHILYKLYISPLREHVYFFSILFVLYDFIYCTNCTYPLSGNMFVFSSIFLAFFSVSGCVYDCPVYTLLNIFAQYHALCIKRIPKVPHLPPLENSSNYCAVLSSYAAGISLLVSQLRELHIKTCQLIFSPYFPPS